MIRNVVYYMLIVAILLANILILPYTVNSQTTDKNPFYIALIIHIHQPIYDVSRNVCDLVSNTNNNVYYTFRDRSIIYTYRILDLIDYIENNNLPANITIDITGTLIENLENLSLCASTIPGLENYTYVDSNWSSRSYTHVEFLSTMYHYNLLPMLTRVNEQEVINDIMSYGVNKHNESLYSFTGKYPGFEGIVGFHPPELAIDNESLSLIKKLGFDYTIVDDLHIYRVFPDYPTPRRPPEAWYTGQEISIPSDPLFRVDKIAGDWIYLKFTYSGTDYYHVMNPYIGLRPHVINTEYGPLVVFPRNRFMSVLMHGIMYFTNDNIDQAMDWFFSIIDYLEQYNTDPNRPFILVMDFDGDNGDPLTHQYSWWNFVKKLIENVTTPGSPYSYVKFVSPAWYLKHVYNPLNDNTWEYAKLSIIEKGSWSTDTTWGDPYFTKWIYPSKYSNEQKILNNITRAVNYYVNAKTVNPSDPRLENITYWLSLATQSDWFYYPTNDFYNNATYAVDRAVALANTITSTDYVGPTITFGWFEVPSNNYKPGLIYSDSKPYIKIHVKDTSGVQSVTLTVRAGPATYTYTMSEELDLSGNYYVQITDTLPRGAEIILEFTAVDTGGRTSTYTYVLGKVVDIPYVFDGVIDTNTRVLWVNTTNTILRKLYVNDTLDYIYIASNTTTQGSGYDAFVFVSVDPSRGYLYHPWAKLGRVPYYDMYIGVEEYNGWNGLWMKLNGIYGVSDVLIGASWMITYRWSTNGLIEIVINRRVFTQYYNTDRLFLGIASWGTADYSSVYEKLRMVSTSDWLYKDEMMGIYLGEPILKPYFMPDNGVTALNEIINAIRSAKSYIYIAIYNWANQTPDSLIWRLAEEVVNAKNRGVWVAVVVDYGHSNTDPINYLRNNGIYPVVETGYGIMHNKFIVVDGVITFMGSANLVDTGFVKLGDEYQYNDLLEVHSTWFSKPYEYEFIEMYYKKIFHGGDPTPTELAQQTMLLNNTWVKIEYYFMPEEGVDLENKWLSLITSSSKIYTAVYVFTRDSIADSLIAKYKAGGDVKVAISYNEKDAYGTEYYTLINASVPTILNYDDEYLAGYQLLHHKFFVFDDKIVSTGSTNPTTSGLTRNDENTIIIYWDKLGSMYAEWFEKLWNKYVAHITVKVYEGDRLAVNAFVNVTTYDLGTLTNNLFTYYNYTGYTNSSGLYYVEAYLWNPNITAKFTINVSTSNGWNATTIYLGLNNNTVYLTLWITIKVKPVITVSGPLTTYVNTPTEYTVTMTYANGTVIDRNLVVSVYINGSYVETITLVSGTGTYVFNPTSTGYYNLTFIYSGGDWIKGLLLEPTSTYIIVEVREKTMSTQLVVSGATSAYYGETLSYTIELRDNQSNIIPVDTTVMIYINGTWVANVTLSSGRGSWTFNYGEAGYYNLTFIYPGGDTYNGYVLEPSDTSLLVVVYEAPTTIVIDTVSQVSVNTSFTIKATLLNDATNTPISNALLKIYINGTLVYSGYTGSDGSLTYSYKPTIPGRLEIRIIYSGEPGKYLSSLATKYVDVVTGIETILVVSGPETIYVGEEATYTVMLQYINGTVIPFDTGIIIYYNGTRAIVPMTNGRLTIKIGGVRTGIYNLTIVFNGGVFNGYTLLPSKTTYLINILKRPVEIKVKARYTWLNSTYVYLDIEIRVFDKITGEPVEAGYVEIYVNKTGEFKLIAIKSVKDKIVLRGVYDPLSPVIRVVYIDPTGTYVSGVEENAYIESLPEYQAPPAMPEMPTIAVILLIAIIVTLALHGRK